MKKSRTFWNYLDMMIQIISVFLIIIIAYIIAENLEKYFYRYTVFPFVAFILIFYLGIKVGRGVERTRHKKPIGMISKKMAKARKRKNIFIFSDDGETYTPHKEIIEDIKSGEIVHVKQFQDDDFVDNDFSEIYKIDIDEMIDNEMGNNGENE